jgi:hypothetical protein
LGEGQFGCQSHHGPIIKHVPSVCCNKRSAANLPRWRLEVGGWRLEVPSDRWRLEILADRLLDSNNFIAATTLLQQQPCWRLSGFVDPAYQQTGRLDASSDGYALGASPTNTAPQLVADRNNLRRSATQPCQQVPHPTTPPASKPALSAAFSDLCPPRAHLGKAQALQHRAPLASADQKGVALPSRV